MASKDYVGSKLSLWSDDASKTYAKQTREIEAEWAEMYQKFMRMLGRADKLKGLEAAQTTPEAQPEQTRSDLLRKHRRALQ